MAPAADQSQSKGGGERWSDEENEEGDMLSFNVSNDVADNADKIRGKVRCGSMYSLLAISGGGNEKGNDGWNMLEDDGTRGGFLLNSILVGWVTEIRVNN